MFSVKAGKLADNIFCFNEVIYCVTQSTGTLTTKNMNNFWVRLEVYARYYHYLTDEEKKNRCITHTITIPKSNVWPHYIYLKLLDF